MGYATVRHVAAGGAVAEIIRVDVTLLRVAGQRAQRGSLRQYISGLDCMGRSCRYSVVFCVLWMFAAGPDGWSVRVCVFLGVHLPIATL